MGCKAIIIFGIGVTLNTNTHLGLEDATDELWWKEDLENARKELEKQGREARITENVPGDIIWKVSAPCFGRAFFGK